MLQRVRISGLGVIEDAELELAPGLNVLTGETGAGKTMVVSGLGLLLGARADAGLVRPGARAAVVEGEVDVRPDHPAAERVRAAGGDTDDGLVLVRTLSAEGRSRAHVGGRTAPVGVLAEVGQHLVAVHGQADQWRLRRPEEHRALLDAAGGSPVAAALDDYRQSYTAWVETRERLAGLSSEGAERTLRVESLRAALAEIEQVAPEDGEEAALAAESERLDHGEALRHAAAVAQVALTGDEDDPAATAAVVDLLAQAGQEVRAAAGHDAALAELGRRLDELGYLASDLAADLASYAAGVDVDPERLAWVHERRAALTALLRRYGPTTADALELARRGALELADLESVDDRREELQAAVAELEAQVAAHGAILTQARREAAAQLSRRVEEELAHLAMAGARVEVAVEQPRDADGVALPDGTRVRARAHGLDEVEIRLAANAGAPPRSVTRAASGGELSRVMLALEVVSAEAQLPTYVFDEVDAGVGGAAALDLGARLARLAEHAQVIVVTHLGQVAAFADRHHVVRKHQGDGGRSGPVTASDVAVVEREERVAEIARMIGGVEDSEAALRHARELVEEHAPQRTGRQPS
ncbi:DNA repair protein RecN [Ornithinicoccus halotolerans]|uniref:DNA repair protein RecN n=1 Tax=Ornithinicoccus halotolerans TaxID=1748220 RepID=UPI0012967149|nr:DNA repair protein RecN [Ornithinicoccus halotolerans]